jgi:hypothetical protein
MPVSATSLQKTFKAVVRQSGIPKEASIHVAWQEEWRQALPPVPYFPVVLTLPQELRALVRGHQQDLYAILLRILLRAPAQARMKLGADPHDVDSLIGVLCVLHTWTRALVYHPLLEHVELPLSFRLSFFASWFFAVALIIFTVGCLKEFRPYSPLENAKT